MKYITKVFVIEDDPMTRELIKTNFDEFDYFDVSLFGTAFEFYERLHESPDIIILDYFLQDLTGLDIYQEISKSQKDPYVIFFSGQEDVNVVVKAYKLGVKNYIVKGQNAIVELMQAVNILKESIDLKKELVNVKEAAIENHNYTNIIGRSSAMKKVIALMQKIEQRNITILITGESGTGKELIASSLHFNSLRKRKDFIPVDLGAIPNDLMESELFGHEKGAFTGAESRRIGKIEQANGGTLFLDEIGEMDINMQTRLLRVLQESTICRLGSNKVIHLDLRIILATNKDLKGQVQKGLFRKDLFYRIVGFPIHLPPLRERENDILILARHFLNEFAVKNKTQRKSLSADAAKFMMKHDWSGNIRELKTFIERVAIICDSDVINADDLIFI